MSLTKFLNDHLTSLQSLGKSILNTIFDPSFYTRQRIFSFFLHSVVLPVTIFAFLTILRRKLLTKPGRRARNYLKQTYGGWALVTGASSGIGTDFAKILASEGFNVVLTARTESSLKNLAEEIERDYHVETRIVLADLSKKDGARLIFEQVSDLDIGLFINNAGQGWFGFVKDQEIENIENLIQLNCTSMAVLTQLFVGKMRQRGQASGIIITSSLGSYFVMPLCATYSSAKAMVSHFGGAVSYEEMKEGGNVHITVLEPGATATNFAEKATEGRKGNRSGMTTSEHVANQALNYLAARRTFCVPVDSDYYVSLLGSFLPFAQSMKLSYDQYKFTLTHK